MRRSFSLVSMTLLTAALCACHFDQPTSAQPQDPPRPTAPPATGGKKVGRLPPPDGPVAFDMNRRQVRVDCEALAVETPLEFFCVLNNTSEHESVLRTAAKPSNIHIALLTLGLQPGRPVQF